MKCEDVRQHMLEGDFAALDRTSAAVAKHLMVCNVCLATESMLRAQHDVLAAEYLDIIPQTRAADAARLVLAGASGPGVASEASGAASAAGYARARPVALLPRPALPRSSRLFSRRTQRVTWATFASLAAAAVFMLMAWHSREAAVADDAGSAPRAPFSVTVPANQSAIVFETNNPNITVVWLYSGD